MASIRDILAYTQQNTRNRIVFCRDGINELKFVDVGKELSALLEDDSSGEGGFGLKCRQVINQVGSHPSIGNYIAIENIGILFESELKIDLRSVLDSYSKDQCLFIKSDAVIEDSTLHFLSPADSSTVDLSGLSYKII